MRLVGDITNAFNRIKRLIMNYVLNANLLNDVLNVVSYAVRRGPDESQCRYSGLLLDPVTNAPSHVGRFIQRTASH